MSCDITVGDDRLMISSGVCFIISGDVQCVERDLKPASSLRYTADDLLHVAMIATNVNR